ncbi:hypothetical protein ACDY96_03920 [Rhizobium mongolense]|uniref:hypothetical protein n=1 Tax=Rhizobium mongolense TaxID=57676 RepID=UPI003556C87F
MTINIKDIDEKDRNSVLHPFTQLKDFATGKLGPPPSVYRRFAERNAASSR